MKKLLVVVDMQKDFIDGSLGAIEAVAIVPKADTITKRLQRMSGSNWLTGDIYKKGGDSVDRTLISIEMVDERKFIHYLGYGYYAGESAEKPYRWVDYTFLTEQLDKVIAYGIKNWEADHQELAKQYIQDLSEKEYDEIEEHEEISYKDITAYLPCGLYYCVY